MYFWKINKLKKDITSNKFSEKDRFIYAAIYVVLSASFMELMSLFPIEKPNIWDYIRPIANTLIVLFGFSFAYVSNGGNNGTDFLGRFFSIGFVISIRFIVILIPIFAALAAYYGYYYDENEEIVSTASDNVPFLIWYTALFWRICVHIKDVNNTLTSGID